MLDVQAWRDEYTWDCFCVMWRLIGNEILQGAT
jgi:hypothetical protein